MSTSTIPIPRDPTDDEALALFKAIEEKFPSQSLGDDKWYVLLLAAMVGGGQPGFAPLLYKELIKRPECQTPEQRQALMRRIRETLFKLIVIVGVCKPLEAIFDIDAITRPEDKDYTFSRIDWTSKQITYGLYLSDHSILNDVETELTVLSGIMIQNLPRETAWHLRGTRRIGVSKEDVETIQQCQDQDGITTATLSPSLRQWAHLPEELKIYVLCFVVGDIPESPVPDSNYTVIFRKHMEPIYEVRNKELYRLARTAYYNNNVFEICIEEKPSHSSQRVTFRYPPAEIASMIRHLRVTVKTYTMDVSRLEHILLCNSQPLAFMLQATRPVLQSNELGLPLPINIPSGGTRVGFDALPDELKVQILTYALSTNKYIMARNHKAIEKGLNLPTLLLVNKRMHALAAQVYYSGNTFVVRRSGVSWGHVTPGADDKWRFPPFVFGSHVRKLVIQLELYRRIDNAAQCLEPSLENDWLVLLRPRPAHKAATLNAPQQAGGQDWQNQFPKLSELTVRLSTSLSLHLQINSDSAQDRRALLDLPNKATVVLQPKLLRLQNDSGAELRSSDPMHGAIHNMVKLRI
ncbi:uncharacterized protein J4E78_003412 [Alternaria triticimaculans]|uniref:uncharacterized protein n=1 Tax=Alternaria triticimaculans TaxID=297637 RepID=UPI0020C4FFAF|nr:uncharacterized protein J4E78_003412 [Alternaria triticimaculans]KAI4665947.1 hypothetical protein J4E78_003412 [Alternaria triticimaculans]